MNSNISIANRRRIFRMSNI